MKAYSIVLAAGLLSAMVWALPPRRALQQGPATPGVAAHALFTTHCAMCHGDNGKGYPGMGTPDFTRSKWQAAHTDGELQKAITNGVSGSAMPSFKQQLTSAQIHDLVHFVIRGFAHPAAH